MIKNYPLLVIIISHQDFSLILTKYQIEQNLMSQIYRIHRSKILYFKLHIVFHDAIMNKSHKIQYIVTHIEVSN